MIKENSKEDLSDDPKEEEENNKDKNQIVPRYAKIRRKIVPIFAGIAAKA